MAHGGPASGDTLVSGHWKSRYQAAILREKWRRPFTAPPSAVSLDYCQRGRPNRRKAAAAAADSSDAKAPIPGFGKAAPGE